MEMTDGGVDDGRFGGGGRRGGEALEEAAPLDYLYVYRPSTLHQLTYLVTGCILGAFELQGTEKTS